MRGRPRFQTGRITKQGENWRGDYFCHLAQPDGTVKRAHRSVVLGARSEVRETDARRNLAEIIAKETHTRPDGSISLEWFVTNRWLPMKKTRWKASTLGTNEGIIQHQIIQPLGLTPLEQIDKFKLQMHLASLAERYSYSVVQHVHSFIRDIFAEAQEQDYIQKSPALRLQIPRVARPATQDPRSVDTGKPFLSLEQLTTVLQSLPNVKRPDRVIVMLASLCALRPGEVFGLTWQCYTDDGLYIMQRVYRGVIDTPKSEASRATIPVPAIVRASLDKWKTECYDSSDEAFVFATKAGAPLNVYNFLQRVLGPAGKVMAVDAPVNFQMLRRSWATHAGNFGADMKILEAVLRHSASLNFSVGTYQQAIREKVLEVMNKFAGAVAWSLTDVAPPTPEQRKVEREIEGKIERLWNAGLTEERYENSEHF